MNIEKLKDVAMKSMTVWSAQALNTNSDVAARRGNRLWLQFWMMTLMAPMMLSISTIAFSASEHEATSHEAAEHNPSNQNKHKAEGTHKPEASEKIYPSRAAQDVEIPLSPGATLHKMTLSHHELEPWSFVPKRKDRIEIKNLSNITHALYVTYPDGKVVNLEIQIPGDVVSWTVPDDAEGEYIFSCWIHPVIRANMTIEE